MDNALCPVRATVLKAVVGALPKGYRPVESLRMDVVSGRFHSRVLRVRSVKGKPVDRPPVRATVVLVTDGAQGSEPLPFARITNAQHGPMSVRAPMVRVVPAADAYPVLSVWINVRWA